MIGNFNSFNLSLRTLMSKIDSILFGPQKVLYIGEDMCWCHVVSDALKDKAKVVLVSDKNMWFRIIIDKYTLIIIDATKWNQKLVAKKAKVVRTIRPNSYIEFVSNSPEWHCIVEALKAKADDFNEKSYNISKVAEEFSHYFIKN